MSNIRYIGRSLGQLCEIYKETKDPGIVDYVKITYGLQGLVSLDVNLAISIIYNLLLDNPELLRENILSATPYTRAEYLDCLVELMTRLKINDQAYNNLIEVLTYIDLHPLDAYDEKITRSFVNWMVNYTHSDDCIIDGAKEDVAEAIVSNDTLSREDVFNNWLNKYPIIAKSYIIEAKTILFNKIKDCYKGEYVNFGMSTILVLLYNYQGILENTLSNPEDINIEMCDITDKLINRLLTEEMEYTSDNMGALFKETAYSRSTALGGNLDERILEIIRLFWTIYLYNARAEVIEEREEYEYDSIYNKDFDLFKEMYTKNTTVLQGKSEGLINALYYSEMYISNDIYNFMENKEELEYIDARNRIIDLGILPAEYFHDPKKYIEESMGVLFPFISKYYEKRSGKSSMSDETVETADLSFAEM